MDESLLGLNAERWRNYCAVVTDSTRISVISKRSDFFSTNSIAAVYPALRKGIECFRILKITVFSQIYYARTIHATITSIRQQRYFQSSSIKTWFLFKRFVFVQVVQLQVSKNPKRFNNVKNILMKSRLCKPLRTDIDVYQSWFYIENLFDQRKENPYRWEIRNRNERTIVKESWQTKWTNSVESKYSSMS